MKVTCSYSGYHRTSDVFDMQELEALLGTRDEAGLCSFFLAHGDEDYPLITLLVKDDIAYLHYCLAELDAGSQSMGEIPVPSADEDTTFVIGPEKILILNRFVVPFSTALSAAAEFMASRARPQSIQWFEL